jgi:hypothetical protein
MARGGNCLFQNLGQVVVRIAERLLDFASLRVKRLLPQAKNLLKPLKGLFLLLCVNRNFGNICGFRSILMQKWD